MNGAVEQFINTAKLNNIKTKDMNSIIDELNSIGYNDEEYFTKDNISIVKALAANAKEANAIIDVSEPEKLSAIIDYERLIILIDKNKIFDDMHKAYREAYKSKSSNYMIFVSQESKTADIEKQLVSGVQGSKSVEFVLV